MSSFKNYIDCHAIKISSIFDITPKLLEQHYIKGLVFDFDGVLNSDNTLFISDKAAFLLKELLDDYKVAVHSNADLPERKQYFATHFPGVKWVDNPPKKPSPNGLKNLSKYWNLPIESILMIDDRLMTGGLAAFRANSRFAWITSPVTNYRLNPIRELFFSLLRALERITLYCFQIR